MAGLSPGRGRPCLTSHHGDTAQPGGDTTPPDGDTTPRALRETWTDMLWRRRWTIGFCVAIAAGIVFRLIWPGDMEYKGDEAWTVDQIRAFWQNGHLPLIGMRSSAGLPNAGLSLWIFIAISAVLPSDDPLALARAVQVINIAAIVLLAVFARFGIDRGEREPWLWSVALVAVNPLAVLFSRKIWPAELLPLFTVAMLAAWWYRKRWWSAFAWGFVGALLGQIQLCGFFFAAAFFAATLLFDRRAVHWPTWLMGSILGALPLVPWLIAIAQGHPDVGGADLGNLLMPDFYQHWLSLALGLDLHYALGDDFLPFLARPYVGSLPTYLAGAFLGLIVACFATILLRFTLRLRSHPASASERIFTPGSSTALALNAAFWGYGVLLILTARPVFLHYLIVTFSLPALWLAWLDRAGLADESSAPPNSRPLLASLALAQACVTVLFLSYIHDTQFIAGDYGTAYRSQSHQDSVQP